MKKIFFSIILMSAFMSAGCREDQTPVKGIAFSRPPSVPMVVQQPKKVSVRYAYHGDRFKDPFMPISTQYPSSSLSEDVPVPTLGALILKGIITDDKQPIAIISAGGITYVLKGRRLFDNRQRLVKGITGVIGTDSVLMIGADKSTKELKLRERP